MDINRYSGPPSFHAEDLPNANPEEAAFHILPVPWERSVSYEGGTRFGPAAILHASTQLESYLNGWIPGEAGVHTTDAIRCDSDAEATLARIESATAAVLELGKLPILLGGEHALTLGPVRACQNADGEIGVVQFDAHADLREAYQGDPYSHASVMRRVSELGLPIFQIGVRALCQEEADYRKRADIRFLDPRTIIKQGWQDSALPPDFPKKIYLSFDVDGLDPSIMPMTGTPVPGGLSWLDALDGIEDVLRGRTLVGADLVELAPQPHYHAADFLAAQLVYSIMEIAQRLRALA